MARTTHRSSKGTKLYAVRDAEGQFEDIQTFKRAHGQDVQRDSAAERMADQKAAARKKAAKKAPAKQAAKKAPAKKSAAKKMPMKAAKKAAPAKARAKK